MIKTIFSEIKGCGQNVVLIHGWGMHGGLWGKFKDFLSENHKIHALDLPGFGFSKDVKNNFTLDSMTEAVEDYIKDISSPITLIGWSLGGLIAQNILSRKRINIDKVVLIATTPSFTKKEGWDAAMEQSVFDAFSSDLKLDYKKTLKRFLSLQVRGSDLTRDDLKELNNKLIERGEPNLHALESGLKILSETDLRNNNKNNIPSMIVLGEKDTLIPLDVITEFEKVFPNLEKIILKKAGHAPFISNPDLCAEKIKNFVNE